MSRRPPSRYPRSTNAAVATATTTPPANIQPSRFKDKPVGVINCYTTKEYQFTPEEIEILQMIANQAAIAIENTNLLENFENAKEALESRKVIERAKGLLMKEKQLSEEEAFRFMQKQAMNMRRSMREIAEALILSEGLKGK